MNVILPIGNVLCGSCGAPLHQFRMDKLGIKVEAQCWSEGCENYRKVVKLEAKVIEAEEVSA